MSKRSKLEKIYLKIAIANEQIKVLTKFIGFYTANDVENQVCAEIIREKSKHIDIANEKIAKMFKF